MDTFILHFIKGIGAVGLVALLAYLISCVCYRLYRNYLGWPVLKAALREYRKTHPEAFKRFDDSSLDS